MKKDIFKIKTILNHCTENAKGSIVVPDNITVIEHNAFKNCRKITEIYIPASVEDISMNAFPGCVKLRNFKVSPDNPKYSGMGGMLLSKDKKELITYPSASGKVIIPDGVKIIQAFALDECDKMTSVLIPESVTDIDAFSFSACTSLRKILLKNKNTAIWFDCCQDLKISPFDSIPPDCIIYIPEGSNYRKCFPHNLIIECATEEDWNNAWNHEHATDWIPYMSSNSTVHLS